MSATRIVIGTLLTACAAAQADAAEAAEFTGKPGPRAYVMPDRTGESIDERMSSCRPDDIGVVTIYTSVGRVQAGVDVMIDGDAVGSLTAHYPGAGPACRTPTSAGVITLVLPAGAHTVEARSPNVVWSGHAFDLRACECLLLPLSD